MASRQLMWPALAIARTQKKSQIVTACALAFMGLFFLFGVGFAHADLLHNAAHDSRHAFTFPCH